MSVRNCTGLRKKEEVEKKDFNLAVLTTSTSYGHEHGGAVDAAQQKQYFILFSLAAATDVVAALASVTFLVCSDPPPGSRKVSHSQLPMRGNYRPSRLRFRVASDWKASAKQKRRPTVGVGIHISASLTRTYCKLPQTAAYTMHRVTMQPRHSDFHLVAILSFQLLTFSRTFLPTRPTIRT